MLIKDICLAIFMSGVLLTSHNLTDNSISSLVVEDSEPDTSLTGEFVKIESGKFLMGSKNGENDEYPVHEVTISQSFEIGKYEVTQQQWQLVMGNNPSYFKGDKNLPIENVSWEDVQKFISEINKKSKKYVYRLPTEAEWEYACRAGSKEEFAGNLSEMAWYEANSLTQTHPVGEKKPNAWGLYDMHGNVYEWCSDLYGKYPDEAVKDPAGDSSGISRVYRGGGYFSIAVNCRSANRYYGKPDAHYDLLGFRLVRNSR